MPFFSSQRERRLWIWALAVILAIYATLGFAGSLAAYLRARNLLNAAFFTAFLIVIGAVALSGLKRRPGKREIWVMLGAAAVYGMVGLRLFMTPEERTHLFEYGLAAALIYQALTERARNNYRVPAPAVLAVAATALIFSCGLLLGCLQQIGPAPAEASKLAGATLSDTYPALALALDSYINGYVGRERFSGSVLVARRGHVLLSKGYGMANREHDIPNTPHTKFRLGSVCKQFTGAAILHLQQRGRTALAGL